MQTKIEPTIPESLAKAALSTTRLVVHGALLVRHTFFPSVEEAQGSTVRERAQAQLQQNGTTMANDLVWATSELVNSIK